MDKQLINIFSKIKSSCKTRTQRLAFNAFVKSFSNHNEVSAKDFKTMVSKIKDNDNITDVVLSIINFIKDNGTPRDKKGFINTFMIGFRNSDLQLWTYEEKGKLILSTNRGQKISSKLDKGLKIWTSGDYGPTLGRVNAKDIKDWMLDVVKSE